VKFSFLELARRCLWLVGHRTATSELMINYLVNVNRIFVMHLKLINGSCVTVTSKSLVPMAHGFI